MTRLTQIVWSAAVAVSVLVGARPAAAGWVIISNDTPAVLIVQETGDEMSPAKRPKTVRLLPGEVYREFHAGEGKTNVQVFDARMPKKPVYRGQIKWGTDDVGLKLEAEGTTIKMVQSPATPNMASTVVPASSTTTKPK